jgi:hypothetical protein
MRIILQMAPILIHGSRKERVKALGAIGVRFSIGAFVVATLLPYIEPHLVRNDLPDGITAFVGGAVIAAVATCLKSV